MDEFPEVPPLLTEVAFRLPLITFATSAISLLDLFNVAAKKDTNMVKSYITVLFVILSEILQM